MRRKSSRTSSKSTPEAKTETRKSTRSSRRRKSPSVEPEECTTSNVNDSINDYSSDKPEDVTSLSLEKSTNEIAAETSFEEEPKNEDDKGGHTPPRVESTGNEEPKKDELDAEKGKSKGISNSQLEENSEIQMNSVTTSSPDEAIKNEVNPDVTISVNDEISENQNVRSEVTSEECSDDKPSVDNSEKHEKNEESLDNSEVITEKNCVESDEKCTAEIEKSDDVNGESVEKVETEHSKNNIEAEDDQAEEGEIRESKSDEENESYLKESSRFKAKKTPLKIKLRRESFFDSIEKLNEVQENRPAKKIKWDPEMHGCLKMSLQDLHRLDIEDFKTLTSDLKLAEETEVKLEAIYQPKVVKERVKSMDTSSDEVEKPEYLKQVSTASSDESTNLIAINRKISIVEDGASKLKPPPSPAKEPVSPILYISNLVRPFTLKQLKELLERTGTIKEGGFWTDRIKSKCYVWYDSIEEAEATRNALHGVNWPVGNGKKLIIEYATEEQMEKEKNPPVQPPPQPVQVTPPRAKTPQKENTAPVVHDQRNGERKRKESERERERERTKPALTREWDIGKEGNNKERNRSRSRDRRRRHSDKRSPTPLEDFIARKQRKLEESVPQKLMDDLFQRTKAMPCIYWQPLSPEEISVKQQQRLTRMEEHKRRLEENSRNRGVGARDRGSYRRRYD